MGYYLTDGVCTRDSSRYDAGTMHTCATGLGLYVCPYSASCLGGALAANASTMTARNAFCAAGYDGPLCFVCESGYYRDTGGSCARCGDVAAAKAAFAVSMSLFGIIIVLLLTTFVYGIPETVELLISCVRRFTRPSSSVKRRTKMTYQQLQRSLMIKQVTSEVVAVFGDKIKMVCSFARTRAE